MRRILGILLLVAGVALGIFWYVQRAKTRALNSGDVFVREQPGEAPKPLPSSPSAPTPATPPTPAPTTPAAVTPAPVTPAPKPSARIATPATPAPVPAASAVKRAAPPPSGQASPKSPSLDLIPRDAPNGALYAASGKYQLYRQGDITWRLNTDTGWACVIFATDAQWARNRVWREGCRTSGDVSPPITGN